MGKHLESTSFSSTAPIKTKAGTWQKPGTPSLSSLGLAGHSRAPQLSPCVLWSQTHPSSESGGQNKTKKKEEIYEDALLLQISSPQSFANDPPRIGCVIRGVSGVFFPSFYPPCTFPAVVCCCSKPIFLRIVRISERLSIKGGPGSWVINIIFLTCLALSATCKCSLPRVGSSSLTFPELPRSFSLFSFTLGVCCLLHEQLSARAAERALAPPA